MDKTLNFLRSKTTGYIRVVLFLAFLGHGLVSLGFSPGQSLHLKIITAINFTSLPSDDLVIAFGWFDIIISFLFLFNIGLRWAILFSLSYLTVVVVAVVNLYQIKTGSLFGFAEILRRFSWILLILFLFYAIKGELRYYMIRLSSASAFLAHGIASLGFFGFSQAHVEIASQIIPEEYVSSFILFSGISDVIIGSALLFSFKQKLFALIGTIWISLVVMLSGMIAIPDGIFRAGFLLVAFYNYIDLRTAEKWRYGGISF